MTESLSRGQSILLGLVVLLGLGAGVYGIVQVADRQGLFAEFVELEAGFPEAHDLGPGTVVRLRGVDAGQVTAVEYPDHDDPGAEVVVRMKLAARFADRIYADATAQVYGSSMVGPKVIAINPGTPSQGRLTGRRIPGLKSTNTDEAIGEIRKLAEGIGGTAEEVRRLAHETTALIHEVRQSNGTLMKLVKDDSLLRDLQSLVAQAQQAVGTLEKQSSGLGQFITDGRDTLRSIKQSTDAFSRLPIIRGYVEDAARLLVRPDARRDMWYFPTADLFEPGTANLHYDGQVRLNNLANIIKENKNPKSEVVVVAFVDPADKTQTAESARELSRKQAEKVVEHLKICEVHKLGTFARRKLTPLGLGMNPSPVIESQPLPPSVVQVMVFTP